MRPAASGREHMHDLGKNASDVQQTIHLASVVLDYIVGTFGLDVKRQLIFLTPLQILCRPSAYTTEDEGVGARASSTVAPLSTPCLDSLGFFLPRYVCVLAMERHSWTLTHSYETRTPHFQSNGEVSDCP